MRKQQQQQRESSNELCTTQKSAQSFAYERQKKAHAFLIAFGSRNNAINSAVNCVVVVVVAVVELGVVCGGVLSAYLLLLLPKFGVTRRFRRYCCLRPGTHSSAEQPS